MSANYLKSTFATTLFAAVFFMGFALPGQAANYRWTGGGTTHLWSDVGNWEVQMVDWEPAATPPGTGDLVMLGDTTATDESQEIVLTDDVEILQLKMEATGNRNYVISGAPDDTHTLTLTAAIWEPAIEQVTDATCDLVLRVKVSFSAATGAYLRLYSSAHARMIAQREVTASSTGTYSLFIYGNVKDVGEPAVGGILELQAPMGINSKRLAVNNSGVLLLNYESENPVVASSLALNTHGSLWVQRSATIDGGLWFSSRGYIRAYQSGDSNIVLNVKDVHRGGDYHIGPSLPESAATFTLTINNMTGPVDSGIHTPDLNLASNTVLALGRNQTLPISLQVLSGIHGAGALVKSTIAPGYQATSTIGLTNTYSGGTFVEDGTMQLIGGDVPVTIGSTTNQYFRGQIGPGLLSVGTNGVFDLNGIDQAVSSLQGEGTVLLGGATLSLTNGVAPGTNGAGTLTIDETGELKLEASGTSQFEFTPDAAVFDRVVFADAAKLTLAGTLEIVAPPDFWEYGSGRYTLFEMAGGPLEGAFTKIIPPVGMIAEIDTSAGDVVLVLRIGGTTILVR